MFSAPGGQELPHGFPRIDPGDTAESVQTSFVPRG